MIILRDRIPCWELLPCRQDVVVVAQLTVADEREGALSDSTLKEASEIFKLSAHLADISHYIEIRIADTWTDHIREHEYVTRNVQVMENRIHELIKYCPQPIISHYIGKSPLK